MNQDVATPHQRLIIISNRLPIILNRDDSGELQVKSGTGGLVTALAPVLKNRGGIWVGWPGMADLNAADLKPVIHEAGRQSGFSLEPILLTKQEVGMYYQGFANEIIWPLFHDLQTHCNFVPAYWKKYQEVNHKFAEKVASIYRPGDFLWVHDYQLMLLGQELRKVGIKSKLGFFLHIPFPPLDIFLKLPWRFEIIRALLEYDLVGFQTMRDKRNFIQCVRTLLKDVQLESSGSVNIVKVNKKSVRVGCFPISIDFDEFCRLAESKEVAHQAHCIHETLSNRKLVLCVDRLDYTKGIPFRLEAFRTLLQQHPELHGKISLVQLIVPSRMDIPKYQALKIEIDRLVGEINSSFSKQAWVPIHYMFRKLTRGELLSYYRTCEIALVTPLKDGMNLVAKEYIASNIEENGVLILSEFAGAAAQLHQNVILINPYDIVGMADAIYQAYHMPQDERHTRMVKMRRLLRRNNIYTWVKSFLYTAISKELVDFPVIQEYIPDELSKKVLSQEVISL